MMSIIPLVISVQSAQVIESSSIAEIDGLSFFVEKRLRLKRDLD